MINDTHKGINTLFIALFADLEIMQILSAITRLNHSWRHMRQSSISKSVDWYRYEICITKPWLANQNKHPRGWNHRHLKSGPPFSSFGPSRDYGIYLNHLSICYNISCYNSLVLITLVFRSSCRITYIYIYIKVWNNRQNTKRESSLRLDILQ